VQKGRGRGRCAGLHRGRGAAGVRLGCGWGGRRDVGPARLQTKSGMERPPSLPAIDLLLWYDDNGAALWLYPSLTCTTRNNSIASSVCLPNGRTKERYVWEPDDPRAARSAAACGLATTGAVPGRPAVSGLGRCRGVAVAARGSWRESGMWHTDKRPTRNCFLCFVPIFGTVAFTSLLLFAVLWRLRRALCPPHPAPPGLSGNGSVSHTVVANSVTVSLGESAGFPRRARASPTERGRVESRSAARATPPPPRAVGGEADWRGRRHGQRRARRRSHRLARDDAAVRRVDVRRRGGPLRRARALGCPPTPDVRRQRL